MNHRSRVNQVPTIQSNTSDEESPPPTPPSQFFPKVTTPDDKKTTDESKKRSPASHQLIHFGFFCLDQSSAPLPMTNQVGRHSIGLI